MPEPRFLTRNCPEFPTIAATFSTMTQTAREGKLTKYTTNKFLRLMEAFPGHKLAALRLVEKYSAMSKNNKATAKTK